MINHSGTACYEQGVAPTARSAKAITRFMFMFADGVPNRAAEATNMTMLVDSGAFGHY